jgi:iron complex transport system substrate-binding protein
VRHCVSIAIAALVLGACAAPGLDDDAASTASEAPSTEPTIVDACPDDTSAEPLPEPSGTLDVDPRTLTGPATAVVSDVVEPITGEASPQLPVVVESCDGTTVTVTDTSRIVTADLYGTLGEIVFSLGLGDRVVGRDSSMGFAQAADVEVVTPGGHQLNAEAILELHPSVVLTDTSIGPPEVIEQLRASGVPVIFFNESRTLDGVPSHIRAVAGALGVPDEGEQLVERVYGEIADALTLVPADGDPLRATFLYIRGGAGVYLMAGPGSGADALIQAIGAVDVGTDIGLTEEYTPLTSEALIAAEPEVIIMMTGGLESVDGVDGLLEIPGVAQTPAGANRRVVDMEDTDLLSFGPRSGATLRAIVKAVYQP